MTYCIIIDGFRWAYGLTKFLADSEVELLNDQFNNPNIVVIKEL